jgi:hypothetical protein
MCSGSRCQGVLATFRRRWPVRREAGEALDDAAVLLLCRQALEWPREDGRSSYQVALTVCEHCRRGIQQGRGELVGVPREIVEMAACDAQDVGHIERRGGRTCDTSRHAGGSASGDASGRRAMSGAGVPA